jgi:hypothetical protein
MITSLSSSRATLMASKNGVFSKNEVGPNEGADWIEDPARKGQKSRLESSLFGLEK